MTLFLVGGTLVFVALWLAETETGMISALDRYAYPVLIVVLTVNLLAIALRPQARTIVELACYLTVAVYLLLQILVFAFWSKASSLYAVSNTLQWMPVLYVAAFVFFSRRSAIILGGGTFALSVVVFLGALLVETGHPLAVEVKALFVNALAAHLLVLLCLTLVTSLRQEFERAMRYARVMEDAAHTDRLTGIANRRGLEQWLATAKFVNEGPSSLIVFDIDHFKSINDRFGHLVGDEVLISTAQRIEEELRGEAILGRWGGEEFLVIVPGGSIPAAAAIADRVRQAVGAASHPLAGSVTLSAGIAIWDGATPVWDAFHSADEALAAAKSSGRNRVATG